MSDIDVLADHYHDSCELVRRRERKRERLLFFVALILALLFLQIQNEDGALKLGQDLSKNFISPDNFEQNLSIIKGALWVALAILVQAYYQTDIYIERAYPYIHEIEGHLNSAFGGNLFCREGRSYGENYPRFLWWTHFFYKWLVPLFIITFPAIDLLIHARDKGLFEFLVIFRFSMFIVLSLSTFLYLKLIHFKR